MQQIKERNNKMFIRDDYHDKPDHVWLTLFHDANFNHLTKKLNLQLIHHVASHLAFDFVIKHNC